jgi:predicted NBD/HSP70 family sugar kinase
VQLTDRCGVVIAMSEYTFDPPLMLIGNIVVRNLDDAVRFMVGYRKARRPALQTSVLYRLEGAAGEAEERDAGKAFLGWAEAEHLIVKLGE